MNSLAVFKRVLAAAGVIAILSFARPAGAVPLKYFYTITAPPQWGVFGNPQPVAGWSALTALNAGPPLAAENFVSLSLLGYPGHWYAFDTFLGEANGFVGADVSVPTAQWITPAVYTWAGGPAGGGALAFFNSFNPFTGVFFANELIVLDPPSCDALCTIDLLETSLGSTSGSLTPTTVTLDSSGHPMGITIPGDDEDASIPGDPLGTDYFASGSVVTTPEGPTSIYVLLGVAFGAVVYFRRGRPLLPAA